MSADIRLDPVTLRWCAAKLRAGLLAPLEVAANQTVTLGAYEDAEEAVDLATAAIEAIEAAATEARPPLLSDWIRACEGTALGEPTWSGERWDYSGQVVAWFDAGHRVVMHVDGRGAPMGARITDDPREGDGVYCSTHAELRAALDRLAAEVKP